MAALHVTSDNYESEVVKSDKPVLIDFWASWCGPCQMIAPIIEELAGELNDVKVVKVNIDEQTELAEKFNVMSIPTLILMDKGKMVNQTMGYQGKSEILSFLGK